MVTKKCLAALVKSENLLPAFQYACQTNNITFVYQNLTFEAQVNFAVQLQDLEEIKHLAMLHNISHVDYLYGIRDACNKDNVALAISLTDTQSLLQICPQFWLDRNDEYSKESYLVLNMKIAIQAGDFPWLVHMSDATNLIGHDEALKRGAV